MFGNNSKSKESGRGNSFIPNSSSHSFNSLVQGTVIEGDVHCKSDIRIDGTIKGGLNCESKVIIGPTGAVEGNISCQNAVIEGRFEGSLTVKGLLTIKERANVSGDIRYGKLVVQPGAVLVGDVRLVGQQDAKQSKSPSLGNESKPNTAGNAASKATLQKETVR